MAKATTRNRTHRRFRHSTVLTKNGDQWVLPHDLVQRRWMHLNESFFYPDGSDYSMSPNGIELRFCHNVKAQPHLDWSGDLEYEVAELGVAWSVSRPDGRARPTRSSPVTLSLACERSEGPALAVTIRQTDRRCDGVRALQWTTAPGAARTHPGDDERRRSVRRWKKSARVLQAGAARRHDRLLQFCLSLLAGWFTAPHRLRVSGDDPLEMLSCRQAWSANHLHLMP